MGDHAQGDIADRLEAMKRRGLIADYFVSRDGPGRRARARVTVWAAGRAAEVTREAVAQNLAGLVAAGHVTVVCEPPPIATTRTSRRLIAEAFRQR